MRRHGCPFGRPHCNYSPNIPAVDMGTATSRSSALRRRRRHDPTVCHRSVAGDFRCEDHSTTSSADRPVWGYGSGCFSSHCRCRVVHALRSRTCRGKCDGSADPEGPDMAQVHRRSTAGCASALLASSPELRDGIQSVGAVGALPHRPAVRGACPGRNTKLEDAPSAVCSMASTSASARWWGGRRVAQCCRVSQHGNADQRADEAHSTVRNRQDAANERSLGARQAS